MYKVVKSLFTGKPLVKTIVPEEEVRFRNVSPVQLSGVGAVYPDPDESWEETFPESVSPLRPASDNRTPPAWAVAAGSVTGSVPALPASEPSSGRQVSQYAGFRPDTPDWATGKGLTAFALLGGVPGSATASPETKTNAARPAAAQKPLTRQATLQPHLYATPVDSAYTRDFYRKRDALYGDPEAATRIDSLVQMQLQPELPDVEHGTTFYRAFDNYNDWTQYQNSSGFRVNPISAGTERREENGVRVSSWKPNFTNQIRPEERGIEDFWGVPIGYAHTHNRSYSAPSPNDMEMGAESRKDLSRLHKLTGDDLYLTIAPDYIYGVTTEAWKRLGALDERALQKLENRYYNALNTADDQTYRKAFERVYGTHPDSRGIWGIFRVPTREGFGSDRWERLVVDERGKTHWEMIEKE